MTAHVDTEVLRYRDAETLATEAANFFVDAAREAISERGMFYVALSGGSTPRALFTVLASNPFKERVDWSRTQVFFGDERFVPADSSDSNYRMARESLLSHVGIHDRFVHRVATEELGPVEAASLYEEGLRRVFNVEPGEVPHFDLILLGLGPDGHTASLFPGTSALAENNALVVANFVESMDSWRITFTYPLINGARRVCFLVQGHDKAERVRQVLAGDPDLPASHVRPVDGRLFWLIDEAAASRLEGNESGSRMTGPRDIPE
ncbi:MAG: 6-phosphogluconolactonase [Chloroflexota bacterium]